MSAPTPYRRTRAGVAAALLAVVLAGCGTPPPAAPAAAPTLAATPTTTPTTPPAPATAAEVLATLPIRHADPVGYRRDLFGQPWADVDHNHCSTRDDILRRDLTDPAVEKNGCTVDSGILHDPYTGTEVTFLRGASTSSAVQIDHVVSLSDAWRSGANRWTPAQRLAYANNPRNLLATLGRVNQAKGDRRADEWLPPDPRFRCRYTAIQVAVKAAPGPGVGPLSVSQPERDALAAVLAGCPGEPARPAGAP